MCTQTPSAVMRERLINEASEYFNDNGSRVFIHDGNVDEMYPKMLKEKAQFAEAFEYQYGEMSK